MFLRFQRSMRRFLPGCSQPLAKAVNNNQVMMEAPLNSPRRAFKKAGSAKKILEEKSPLVKYYKLGGNHLPFLQ